MLYIGLRCLLVLVFYLIDTRKEFDFIFSNEKSIEKENEQAKLFIETVQAETITNTATQPTTEVTTTGLNTNNPYNLKYRGNEANYQIKGFRAEQMDSLKITLQIQIND